MFQSVSRHLRGNAVAYVALFIATGGTAFAATALPANSVGTKQLKNGAVTGQKVAKNTLTASNIEGSTLSKFQRTITGECIQSGRGAISIISADGSVVCASTNITQMMGGSGGANLSGGDEFLAPEGISTPTATRANVELGSTGFDTTGAALTVQLTTAPGTGNSWFFRLVVNGTPTLLGCTIGPAATFCTDSDDTADISPDARVALEASASGTPAPTRVVFGWTDTT